MSLLGRIPVTIQPAAEAENVETVGYSQVFSSETSDARRYNPAREKKYCVRA